MNKRTGYIMLILTAAIWGGGFIAQSVAMDYIGPWTFCCLRNLIAAAVLYLLMPALDKLRGVHQVSWRSGSLFRGGLFCGLALASASMLQQIGIIYTSVGKAGFITSLYVIIVPILSLLIGRKVRSVVWISASLAAVGLYLLSMSVSFALSRGDAMVSACAAMFAVHIMIVDHFSPQVDSLRLSCLQFLTAGVFCVGPMLIFEHPSVAAVGAAAQTILYAGIISSGVGYTFQLVGQKETEPTVASLLLSLESVFAAVFGFLILHQVLSIREIMGCAVMFTAIILAQLPARGQAGRS